MALFSYILPQFQMTPTPVAGTRVSIAYNSLALQDMGFNMQILVAGFLPKNAKTVPKSVVVMGHFDTGATITSVDVKLADILGLVPVGFSTIRTANGETETPNYIASLAFPNTALKPFEKIQISSCDLGFDNSQNSNAKNFGILIGRDIMARWNIVWNGPTSSVFIAD